MKTKSYIIITSLITAFSSVQAAKDTWTLKQNQEFREECYRKQLKIGKDYGVTNDFGKCVRTGVQKVDLKALGEKHKASLEIIKKAMENKNFSWALVGLPLSGKSTISEILSQLLEKPLICVDDFVNYGVLEFEKFYLPQTVSSIQAYRKEYPNKNLRRVLKDMRYYEDLCTQKINEAILFAHNNNCILDVGEKNTITKDITKKLMQDLGIKIIYLRFNTSDIFSKYVLAHSKKDSHEKLCKVTSETLGNQFYDKWDPIYKNWAERVLERKATVSIEESFASLIETLKEFAEKHL